VRHPQFVPEPPEHAKEILARFVIVAVQAQQHVGVEHDEAVPHDLAVLLSRRGTMSFEVGENAIHSENHSTE
jgi:hypothetical protein